MIICTVYLFPKEINNDPLHKLHMIFLWDILRVPSSCRAQQLQRAQGANQGPYT